MYTLSIDGNEYDHESDVQVESLPTYDEPPLYALVLHNDDYTTMEFVVWVLVQVLKLSVHTAYELMMKVHQEGYAAVIVLPKEQAEVKAHQIRVLAEQAEFPLLITLEKQ